jgi:hypothetical protein
MKLTKTVCDNCENEQAESFVVDVSDLSFKVVWYEGDLCSNCRTYLLEELGNLTSKYGIKEGL